MSKVLSYVTKPRATRCVFSHAKIQVAKVSTVRVEKTFALVVQHSQRKFESSLSSSPNWLVVIQRDQFLILVLHSSKLRFIESECDLKMKALFIRHH